MAAARAETSRRPAHGDVQSYPLDDELVIYHPETREGFILNGTAATIWELADGTRTVSAIARELSRSYGISYAQAQDDAQDLLSQLKEAGILREVQRARGGRDRD